MTEIKLAPQQEHVAELLAAGNDIPDIAAALGVTGSAVSTHIRRIRSKIGARNTIHAAVLLALARAHPDVEYASWGRT